MFHYFKYIIPLLLISSLSEAYDKISMWRNYSNTSRWINFNTYPRIMGDANGDGKSDIIAFGEMGTYVALSNGAKFLTPTLWIDQYGTSTGGWESFEKYPRTAGDANGDNKDDIIGFASYGTIVSLSDGTRFLPPTLWTTSYGYLTGGGWNSSDRYPRFASDVNGDGKVDIVGFGLDGTYVSLSDGTKFPTHSMWISQYSVTMGGWTNFDKYPRAVADVNNDGKADVIGFGAEGTCVSLSDGTKFLTLTTWIFGYCVSQSWTDFERYPRYVSDINGDGRADVIGFSSTGVRVSLSNGVSFLPSVLWNSQYLGNFDKYPSEISDVDGDGRADIVKFYDNGTYVFLSTATSFTEPSMWIANFGSGQMLDNYNIFPKAFGDVNNDGKSDLIEFKYNGTYVSLSDGNGFLSEVQWIAAYGYSQGWPDFEHHPKLIADVDGDGRDDIIAFACSTYVSLSDGTKFLDQEAWYSPGCVQGWMSFNMYPRFAADVDGNGKADLIKFNETGVYVYLSNGTKFLPETLWIEDFRPLEGWLDFDIYPRAMADVNNDGKLDVIGFASFGTVVSLSDGTKFLPSAIWISNYGYIQGWRSFDTYPRMAIDMNGDGRSDIVGFAENGVVVSLSDGTKFLPPITYIADFCNNKGWYSFDTYPRFATDINGDKRADIIGINGSGIYVSLHPTLTNTMSDELTQSQTLSLSNELTQSTSEGLSRSQTSSLSDESTQSISLIDSSSQSRTLSLSDESAQSASPSSEFTQSQFPSTTPTNTNSETRFSESDSVSPRSSKTDEISLTVTEQPTATKYSDTLIQIEESDMDNSALPIAVVDASKTAGSIASIASLSNVNTAQGARLATVSNIITCSDNKPFISDPLPWFVSPTRMSVGSTVFRYVDGAILGNWILFGAIIGIHSLIAYKFGAEKVNYPGALVLLNLYLTTPLANSATTLIRLGNVVEQIFGYFSLIIQFIFIIIMSILLKMKFAAKTEIKEANFLINKVICRPFRLNPLQQKWLPLIKGNLFVKYYGKIFEDYRIEWYGFMSVELTMAVASGMLDAFNIQIPSCDDLIYAAMFIYGAYALIVTALSPYRHPLEGFYSSGVAIVQTIPFLILSLQKAISRNNVGLQTTAEIIPVILQYVLVARTTYDLCCYAHDIYKRIKKYRYVIIPENQNSQFVLSQEDKELLLVPSRAEDKPDDSPLDPPSHTEAKPDNTLLDSILDLPPRTENRTDGALLDSILDLPPRVKDRTDGALLDSILDTSHTDDRSSPEQVLPQIHVTDAALNPVSIYERRADKFDIL